MARTQDETASITGINVTPLVDVTLVLLIVFMVAAKAVAAPSIPLDVPQGASTTTTQTVLAIAIDPRGAISLDGQPVGSTQELVRLASEAHARDSEVRAVVHAAETTSHGAVIGVLDALRAAKVTKIAFSVARAASR